MNRRSSATSGVRKVQYCDYSDLRKPLPPPPRDKTWHLNKETNEWEIVDKREVVDDCVVEKKGVLLPPTSSLDNDSNDDSSSYEDNNNDVTILEHTVLSTDTFAGICLAYRISAVQLRQANCFSGTNLKLAPKRLKIPVSTQDLRSGKVQPQDTDTLEFKQHALMADFSSLHPKEAAAYLFLADNSLEGATHQALQDGVLTTELTPIRHLMNKKRRNNMRKHNKRKKQSNKKKAIKKSTNENNKAGFIAVAPMDLPQGFRFLVESPQNKTVTKKNGITTRPSSVLVQVPTGGVQKDELFVPIVTSEQEITTDTILYYPPVGEWKDDVCGCFDRGFGFWENFMGCCCPAILLGQIQTRTGLDCCGGETNTAWWACAVVFWLLATVVMLAIEMHVKEAGPRGYLLFNLVFIVILVIPAVIRTRLTLRRRYAIPGSACGDLCCAWCCFCCVLTQMGRHTARYNQTAGCDSSTGVMANDEKKPTTRTSKVGKLKSKFMVGCAQEYDEEIAASDILDESSCLLLESVGNLSHVGGNNTAATLEETTTLASSDEDESSLVIVETDMDVIVENDMDETDPLLIV